MAYVMITNMVSILMCYYKDLPMGILGLIFIAQNPKEAEDLLVLCRFAMRT